MKVLIHAHAHILCAVPCFNPFQAYGKDNALRILEGLDSTIKDAQEFAAAVLELEAVERD